MAHKKAGGSAKNLNTSQPKYLGVKLYAGEIVKTGQVIVRQRGTKIKPGTNVGVGKDDTLFAKISGVIEFRDRGAKGKFVSIVPQELKKA